ncbi:MAG TPA: hypothetical protein VHV30_17615 [Polyangiaceae bacterium]|nr:hypothetical protein [Polyangiaceae bacterium]
MALAGAAFSVVAAGCSNQGEGEYCDIDAGTVGGDCADGLECVAAPGLSGTPNNSRCCPVAGGAAPTTAACTMNSLTIDGSTEAGAIDDDASGAAPDATAASDAADAGADVAPDAPVESGSPESGSPESGVPESGGDASPSDAARE